MPELDELEVLEWIRALDPAVPAILMSGVLEVEASPLSVDHAKFEPKPYDLDDVVKTLRELLAKAA